MSTSLNFQQIGNAGSEVLMLHGWQKNIFSLLPLAKLLAKNHQVYLVDLPGFGKSKLPSTDWSTADYVQAVKGFIEDHNIQPIVIGHSFGGRIAVKLAALYPDIIADQLVLIGTPGFKLRKNLYQTFRLKLLKVFSTTLKIIDKVFFTKFFKSYFVPRFASADYLQSAELKNILVKTINEDLSPFAEKIHQKTLLLWGRSDEQAGLEQARLYHENIKNSKLQILELHGHEPFEDVGSHLVAKRIREFIL